MTVPLDYAIMCETMHWLLSLALVPVVYFLMWATLSGREGFGTLRLLLSLAVSFSLALVLHAALDYAQWGW